jgi:tellurite methyltransferase
MDISGWDERYRLRARGAEDFEARPTPLLLHTAETLAAGRALDLASGTGRNALWLASKGWQVTAVDGSRAAIGMLRERAKVANVEIEAHVADLRQQAFPIEPAAFDLVVISYYLQRDLFAAAKRALKPGGLLIALVHTTEGAEQPTENRLRPGELRAHFVDWEILHLREGPSADPAHKRSVAEIVARAPSVVREHQSPA